MGELIHPHEASHVPGSAAFLLIIPGALLTGGGIGLALSNPAPGLIVGLGLGFLAWGLIVALRR